jgi:hypothetical protein
MVRRNIKLAESPSYGKSIFDYAPDSNGAKDYERLARELHDPEGLKAVPAAADIAATTVTTSSNVSLLSQVPSALQAAEPLPADPLSAEMAKRAGRGLSGLSTALSPVERVADGLGQGHQGERLGDEARPCST